MSLKAVKKITLNLNNEAIRFNKSYLIPIGKLPGLNYMIDPDGSITHELLQDLPLIDMTPVTYSFNMLDKAANLMITKTMSLASSISYTSAHALGVDDKANYEYQSSNDKVNNIKKQIEEIDAKISSLKWEKIGLMINQSAETIRKGKEKLKEEKAELEKEKAELEEQLKAADKELEGADKKLEGAVAEAFSTKDNAGADSLYSYNDAQSNPAHEALNKILNRYFALNETEASKLFGFRIIGANDSIYTDNIQNSLNNNQLVDQGLNLFEKMPLVKPLSGITSGLTKLDYAKGMQLFTSANGALGSLTNAMAEKTASILNLEMNGGATDAISSIASIVTGKMFGLNIALPRVYESSGYTNSFNLTIRLTSPTGHPDDIQEYIQKPILLLLIAGGPISLDGVNYGFPIPWKVVGHGISDSKVCFFESISVLRGGLDNHYSDFLQPINIDVRITLSPVNTAFMSLMKDTKELSFKNEENMVGIQTPYNLAKSFHANYSKGSKGTKPEVFTIKI